MDYYNSTTIDEINYTGVFVSVDYEDATDLYYYDWTDTSSAGIYNVTYVWANDSYNNVNATTYTDVSFNVTCSIAIDLSPNLTTGINWTVDALPANALPAGGNNGIGVTGYNVSVSASGCNADVYIKADGDLAAGGNVLGLGNETYCYNTSDGTVTGAACYAFDTGYAGNQIGSNLGAGSYVYLKFYLDVPGGLAPGDYANVVSIKAVQYGTAP